MKQLACILIALAVVGVYGDEPDKLVNGIPAKIEDYPHCVSIRVNNNHMCGGSIIDKQYILTAAHCVVPLLQDSRLRQAATVVTGTTYLSKDGQNYKIEKLWHHEKYNLRALGRSPYDIGIIKLASPIELGPNQKAIALPTRDIAKDDKVTIAAWGSTGFRQPIHDNLQKLSSTVMLPEECQKYHLLLMNVHKSELCTLITKGTGLCHGDSGSGLINEDEGTITGLVSGGRPCAQGYPDVYTSVYYHKSWIEEKMKN